MGLDAQFNLIKIASNKSVMTGTTFSRVSYDIPGCYQRFARARAFRDAEDRAVSRDRGEHPDPAGVVLLRRELSLQSFRGRQRVRARRGPMTGSTRTPESSDNIIRSRFQVDAKMRVPE